MKSLSPAADLGRHLGQLAASTELSPEQRVLLRAALAGDPDALLALQTPENNPGAQQLVRALREPRSRPRPRLYLVRNSPEQVG